ncbi:diguanylate cyclase [Pseudoalteromonas sp. SG45-5]|uniref:sensor domain-containing diguanylate cyclase n=1 Tax=unclassified Pseudoalteromonas TaxID=194690 RepID=UPI0015F87DDF|nr:MULTISPECIES: diguanylate cyclase [unclassified Pseudoalteromonas]MBB1384604.1 diguanylate cyclase [Pseudoalteromonas sp. SG45-5]MBB1394071.1 diguanylate cyclase [Pseudoalteromonas sp. SG44-4]MBB1446685.1 diguanylate cyclase [Pseudoalteromonas sp. SG41-6]
MAYAKTLFSLLMLLCAFFSFANPIIINQDFKQQNINSLHYSFAPTSLLNATQSDFKKWQKITNKPLNLGFEKRPVWLYFTLKNTLNYDVAPLLSLDNPLLNEAQVFHLNNSELLSHSQVGDTFKLAERPIKSESLLVKLTLPANSITTVILKVTNDGGLRIPLTLWQQDAYLAHKSKINLIYGLIIGFVFSLALSCLVLYGFSKKPYFAYVSIITLTLGLLLSYFCGFGVRYFHPNFPAIQQIIIPILIMIITLLFLPLQQQICQLKSSFLLHTQNITSSLFAILLLFIWLLPSSMATLLCLAITPIVLSLYLLTTLICIRTNPSKPSKALLFSLSSFLVVMLYFSVVVFDLYAFNRSSLTFVFICFLGCAFSLCYAAMKQSILEHDKQVVTQQTLIAESAAQDALLKERLALQEEASQELEAQVDERTFELQVTLRELEEKNRELEQLNTEDALTGVKNRRFFDKKLIMELRRSRREQTPLSIIMLDIDHFKLVNDTYGHLTGDQVIKAVSGIIKNNLKRPLDEVARYGGEEFVVLLPNTPQNGAFDIAEQMRKAIAKSAVTVASTEIKFTISAGIYTCVADDINKPEIFTECADKALYYAKQNGRDQVVTFPIPQ